ncbi:MAG TPA: carboxypeptidase regulatory-like domain-containing protein [Anaeromyxobacter sp.]
MPSFGRALPWAVAALAAAACSSSKSSTSSSCNPAAANPCSGGLVCEAVAGGASQCVSALVIQGKVFELAAPATGISGAGVIALDASGAPVGPAATSDATGAYEIPIHAARNADGSPAGAVTLRASAAGYETFPSGLRLSFPVNLSLATSVNGRWVVKSSGTDVGLVALATPGASWVQGTVAVPATEPGVLVVAAPAVQPSTDPVRTGYADANGAYAIHDLPSGAAYTVEAYAAGVNYAAQTKTLASGQNVVDLAIDAARPARTVSGTVQLVGQNQPSNPTSVILVLASTYDAALGRGESPPGLRAGNVTSTYSIAGVPDGDYVVLGGFENDGWVRDRGGGAQAPPAISVAGADVTVTGFKITGAVTLGTPFSAADPWTADVASPTFVWVAYPSSLEQTVRIIDAYGTEVWSKTALSGTATSVAYDGPALTSGAYYQFQVIAYQTVGGGGGGPTIDIASQSEDLRGVFVAF